MELKEIKKMYSDLSKTYNKRVKNRGRYTAYKKMSLLTIKELKLKNAKILDLGCGTGLSSLEFFNKKYEVIGIDLTPEMIKEAKKLPFKKLICQNLETPLKVKNGEFDAAVLIGVIEFIKNPLSLFKEVNKKLKPEGIFAITITKKFPKYSKAPYKNYYKKEIEPVFKKAGFKIIECKHFFGFKQLKGTQSIYYYGYVLKKVKSASK